MAGFAIALLFLVACQGGDTSLAWRDLHVTPPTGWIVFESSDSVLGMANAPLGADGVRGARALGAQFTWEPDTVPQDWRDLVTLLGGTIEEDESIDLDGVPGTRLVYRWESEGIPTREMVVLLPARGVVILLQPVLELGERDGPERFDENRSVFDEILASIDFGAPMGG